MARNGGLPAIVHPDMATIAAINRLMKEQGLKRVSQAALRLQRQRCGRGFRFVDASGATIRDGETLARLKSLAMPPAYINVRYASDPRAHLQATGEDAAGRLQYRYHPDWLAIRETVKAGRLRDLARSLPRIRRSVSRALGGEACDSRYAAAAAVRLVMKAAIRAGNDAYARERGTRGATTLLKSNVEIDGVTVRLRFRAKGAKTVAREVKDKRLAGALGTLLSLPGRRLFQYRGENDTIRQLRAHEVNAFLREISGRAVSLKDFRTLLASASVMDSLSALAPAPTKRLQKAAVRDAIVAASETLANTPTVCRKSYVHDSVIAAYEEGRLPRRTPRSLERQAMALARVVARHA
ncbi:MAG: DNA topoisomerase IB [Reyranella sp.]|jgi:DNA topoisomerase-1|nr:MAG: DNA topoisomerase IB [Reyranella sp.]